MRVALVSLEYPPHTAAGGIGSQTYLKAHGLAALGHDVSVVSGSADDIKAALGRTVAVGSINADRGREEYWDNAVRVIRTPTVPPYFPLYTTPARWVLHSAHVAAELSALHARAPLDVVDCPEWRCEGYIHLLNQTERRHIPTAIHLHSPLAMFEHTPEMNVMESPELYRAGLAMEASCLHLADAVFSSSGHSADWCARRYGLNREQIPILHTGVDTRLFAPQPVPKHRRPTIIFVGYIKRHKGAEMLLDAVCALAREYPDVHLRMLGRGDEAFIATLRGKAAAAGLPDLLDLPGFVPHEQLPYHLSQAHIFAVPSSPEGGPGFVYLEAMACGLPVIACAGTGAAEVINPGETGLLVPAGDGHALVGALRSLLSDATKREAMGAHARRYVLAHAATDVCMRRIEAFYAVVCAHGRLTKETA